MAVRNDLIVDWSVSPRVITILSPSTEIIAQDLHDTCRFLEAESVALSEKKLIDTAGKEDLGGGTEVGLTATLQNALLAFENRLGPTYEQCSVSGGNVVAVDSVGVPFKTPIFPTAFTQVVTTASSSATTSNQAQLEHATFNGGVSVNIDSGVEGTDYPIGTPAHPCSNLADAHTIATSRGFDDFFIKSDLTISAGDFSHGHKFIGRSAVNTTLFLAPGANLDNCIFSGFKVSGTLDLNNRLEFCTIDGITSLDGTLFKCGVMSAGIALGGNSQTNMIECYSIVSGYATPFVDIGSGASLVVRKWAGGLELRNKTGTDGCSLDILSGHILVAASCVAGPIVLRGTGYETVLCDPSLVDSHLVNGSIIKDTNVKLTELWEIAGLDINSPMTISNLARIVGSVSLSITDNGDGSVTVSRQ